MLLSSLFPKSIPVTDEQPKSHHDEVVQFAIQMADIMLAAGMSANDVARTMLTVCRTYGLQRVHIDITHMSIVVSHIPVQNAQPSTTMRVVYPRDTDFSRVQRVHILARQIQDGLPFRQALATFNEILEKPRPYPAWVGPLASGGLAASVTMLYSTSIGIIVLAFLNGIAVERILNWTAARGLPAYFQQIVAAGFATALAAFISALGANGVTWAQGLDPTLIVVSGIVLLLSGLMTVGAVQDAIDQFYLTASARLLDAGLRTLGIVVGIVVILQLSQRFGHSLHIAFQVIPTGSAWSQVIGTAFIAIFYALSSFASLRVIIVSACLSVLGWTGYYVFLESGVALITTVTIAAVLPSFVAMLVGRRFALPAFQVISAAILPLVPGMRLYYAIMLLVSDAPRTNDLTNGMLNLATTLGIAMGIATGISLGTYFGRPAVEQLRRVRDLGRRRWPVQ